ncbi:MAG: hypothetical protein AAGB29_00735, partial [Planctomycetota bacterium]
MQAINRSIRFSTAALALAASAGSAYAQGDVTITGATLFEPFFQTAASGNDAIDIDGDGVVTNFNAGDIDTLWTNDGGNTGLNLQYRAVGSGNGLQELIDYGSVNGPAPSFAYIDNINGGAPNVRNGSSVGNPPAFTGPAISDMSTTDVPTTWFVTNTSAGAYWNLAPATGGAATSGYGNNPGVSRAVDGNLVPDPLQAGGQSNKLKSLTPTSDSPGSTTLNLNTGSPDANTIYATPIAAAPIGYIANAGAAVDSDSSDSTIDGNIKKSELQHVFGSGRTVKGENLIAITRDSGSGTRNGAMNSIGMDPSWGMGDNVGLRNRGSSSASSTDSLDTPGPDYIPTNKNSSSRLENTVQNTRLGISYNGIVGNAGPDSAANRYEMLNVMNDTAGGTAYVRPIMNAGTTAAQNNVVFNDDVNTGWQGGAIQTLSTIGNPQAGDIWVDTTNGSASFSAPGSGAVGTIAIGSGTTLDPLDPSYDISGFDFIKFQGDGSGDPTMADPSAALFIRNYTESIAAFNAIPGNPDLDGTPGEALASSFALTGALNALPQDTAPDVWTANPNLNTGLQGSGVVPTEVIEASYGGNYGTTPFRDTSGTYSDGLTANYIANDGSVIAYGSTLTAGDAVGDANGIAGDFDGDIDRDVDDIDDMVTAYEAAAGIAGTRAGLAVAKQSLELMGDFNADGSFDLEDVRYGADGLFNVGRANDELDRRQNFIDVDNASTSGNLFGTTLATGKTYAAGDSAGDIAGSDLEAAGWAPIGADGVVDDKDIDYLYEQFKYDTANAVGSVNLADGVQWSNLDEVLGKVTDAVNTTDISFGQRVDLSADMNGDLTIDQSDVDVLVTDILGTDFGDADLDGDIDTADITTTIGNFTGAGVGVGEGWADGNFDGDGDVDTADITTVIGNFTGAGGGSGSNVS